jgi:hypothetical protein
MHRGAGRFGSALTDVGKADMLKALVSAQASRYAGAYTGILKKTSESA